MRAKKRWHRLNGNLLSCVRQSRRVRCAIILTIALSAMSCTSSRSVSRQSEVQHARHSESVRVDSLVYRDTVIYSFRSDTVFVERTRYRDRYTRDTVRLSDTVQVSEIKEIEKVKRATDWRGLICIFGFVALSLLIIRVLMKCRVLK
nr:MAG TPA: hypothetical protein [Caudoviricetes sp.]